METTLRTVRDLMTADPVAIERRASLEDAFRLLERFPFRHLPVVDGVSLVGILSDRDLLLAASMLREEQRRRGFPHASLHSRCLIGEVMQTPVVHVTAADSQALAIRHVVRQAIGALPVTEEGRLVGIVTSTDLIEAYLDLCLERKGTCDAPVHTRMHSRVTALQPDMKVVEAIDHIDPDVRHAVVLERGELAGIVSDRDLRVGLARELMLEQDIVGGTQVVLRLRDVMTRDVTTIDPSAMLSHGALKMVADKIGALPVWKRGRVLGMLTQGDVLEHYAAFV